MSIYHCSIKTGGRNKGQSAVAAASYRAGDKLHDDELGLTFDYTRKKGVAFSEISLCQNAPDEYHDRATLWNAVHKVEKSADARLWREFEVALPIELSREQQIETVREFVKRLNEQGMCIDWALHDKGDGNPHAHIMATTRSIKENGEWAAKSRKVYDTDEYGNKIPLIDKKTGQQKVDKAGRKQWKNHKEDYNDWNEKEKVEEWRAYWAECCNKRLAKGKQIDHRSYARQGIELIPTIHEGYAARKMQTQGRQSDRIKINEDIRKANTLLQKIADELKTIAEEITRIAKQIQDLFKAEEHRDKSNSIIARLKKAITPKPKPVPPPVFDIQKGVLVKFNGKEKDVIIPKTVREIGERAFCGKKITSVVIPNSVTKIGAEAFMFCRNLNNVTIPDSVKHIEYNAFVMCDSLKNITVDYNCDVSNGAVTGRTAIKQRNVPIPKRIKRMLGRHNNSVDDVAKIISKKSVDEKNQFIDCIAKSMVINPPTIERNGMTYIDDDVYQWAVKHCENVGLQRYEIDIDYDENPQDFIRKEDMSDVSEIVKEIVPEEIRQIRQSRQAFMSREQTNKLARQIKESTRGKVQENQRKIAEQDSRQEPIQQPIRRSRGRGR